MTTKATVPFLNWKSAVIDGAGVTAEQANAQAARIELWFDMGETISDASDMLAAFSVKPAKAPHPLDLAVRHFRDGRRVA